MNGKVCFQVTFCGDTLKGGRGIKNIQSTKDFGLSFLFLFSFFLSLSINQSINQSNSFKCLSSQSLRCLICNLTYGQFLLLCLQLLSFKNPLPYENLIFFLLQLTEIVSPQAWYFSWKLLAFIHTWYIF